mgnify:FL=1
MARKKQLSGYRLHKQRVLFSSKEVIRTVKYPIVPIDKNNSQQIEILNQFKEKIINDDIKLKGDLNLNDYLEYSNQNRPPYTLFDFWLDSLKAGVIWRAKPLDVADFILIFYPSSTSPFNQVFNQNWENANDKIKKFFKKEEFKDIILSGPFRINKSVTSFENQLKKYLKEDFEKSKEAEDLISEIIDSFFDEKGNLKFNGEKQNEVWKEKFNIDKSLLEKSKPKGDLGNITFLIIPELIALDNDISLEQLISKREQWFLEKKLTKEEIKEKWLQEILGLEDNFNGFSNYFGNLFKNLQENNINKIFEALKTFFPELIQNKDKIFQALNYLSEKAKKLGNPSVVTSWADYRSIFGGKLKSWFSNFIKREKELNDQLENLKKGLESTRKYITEKKEKLSQYTGANQEVDVLFLLISRLEEIIEERKIIQENEYELFDFFLSSLKKQLNFFYQDYLHEGDDESSVMDIKEFKEIYEKINKPVAFFGESVKKRNKEVIEKTIPIIEDGINIVLSLTKSLASDFDPLSTFNCFKRKNETEEDNFRKLLQFIFRKLQNSAVNSSRFTMNYISILERELVNWSWKDFFKKKDKGRYVICKSPFAKGSLTKIEIKEGNWLIKYRQVILELKDFLQQFSAEELLKDKNLLLDWIELSKNVLSHLLRFNKKEEFSVDNLNFENFKTAKNYVNLFSLTNVNKEEYGFIIQSLFFSKLKGEATLYTKKSYLARYTFQVIDTDKKFPIFYQPKDNRIILKEIDLNSNDKSLSLPHRYLISLSRVEENKIRDPNFIHIYKESLNKVFLENEQLNNLFLLSSSPYQLQFLDRLLYKPHAWKDIDISLMEWSFVVEKEYKIEWDLETKKPKFYLKDNSRKNKLYLAIPFGIKSTKKDSVLSNVAKNRANYPILGVDVGEYGLAYCLILVDDNQIKVKKTGFIVDKNTAAIKDRFHQIQQKARHGIFDEIDNSVARIRENAIGHLRNQLHVVLITDQGASSVYEYQISNFETGSNKTIKIYDSVKRADVKVDSDADQQIHDHIWGKKADLVGKQLSAYASSYTCSKCHRSFYEIKKNDLEKSEITADQGNILIIKTTKGMVYGFSENKKYKDKSYNLKNTDEGLNEFRKLVKDFARPPVSYKCEVLNKFAPFMFNDKKFFEKFKKDRGNSAIFVCPFVGCQFVADADIQAAFMMALRGYFNFKGIVKTSKENNQGKNNKTTTVTGESYLKETIKLLNNLNFFPDDLFLVNKV